ncbi:MAG: hypothetical protein ACRDHL_10285 [Candidatus Promineifilaceae bacterium]
MNMISVLATCPNFGGHFSPYPPAGAVKSGTTVRYFPFGAFRAAPTAGIHDRGFTGHAHNNRPPDGVGLIYMNARYLVPAVGPASAYRPAYWAIRKYSRVRSTARLAASSTLMSP